MPPLIPQTAKAKNVSTFEREHRQPFGWCAVSGMQRVPLRKAQQDLEAAMQHLLPLVAFASERSCEEATEALVRCLREAVAGEQQTTQRAVELKGMNPPQLLNHLTPGRVAARAPVAAPPPPPQFSAVVAAVKTVAVKTPRPPAHPVARSPAPAVRVPEEEEEETSARPKKRERKPSEKLKEKEVVVASSTKKLALQPWSPDGRAGWAVREVSQFCSVVSLTAAPVSSCGRDDCVDAGEWV
jgi:hypothetical protein